MPAKNFRRSSRVAEGVLLHALSNKPHCAPQARGHRVQDRLYTPRIFVSKCCLGFLLRVSSHAIGTVSCIRLEFPQLKTKIAMMLPQRVSKTSELESGFVEGGGTLSF